MPRDEEAMRVARMLMTAGRDVRRARDANAATLGLTSSQADALAHVVRNPGCSIGDLGSALDASHQSACALVDRMKAAGLVETAVSESDGRVRTIRATARGEEVYAEFVEMGVAVNARLLEGLSEDDLGALASLLERAIGSLRNNAARFWHRACATPLTG